MLQDRVAVAHITEFGHDFLVCEFTRARRWLPAKTAVSSNDPKRSGPQLSNKS